jgi:uncharacterized protein
MSKLLWIGLLAVIVYLILRTSGRRRSSSAAPPAQQMVACAHCGLNLPETESLRSGEQYYCCEQHRGLGPLERKR